MASEPIARESETEPQPEARIPPPRRAFYTDPLSLLSWSIALASIVAYGYFFVRRPAPGPGEQVARFSAIEGRVKVKPNASDQWRDGKLADALHVGDVVQTEASSGAQISFNSGNTVNVRPDSVVYIGGSAESSTAAWRVQSGRVNFSVAQEQTEILTPTVKTTAALNATGNIDVGDEGETGVKIFRGQAEVETRQGQRITLGENQAVKVDSAGKAGARLELPPPPDLVGPEPRALLARAAPPAPTATLEWTAVVNGATYHVAVDFNVTQANLLLSAALDEPAVSGTSHDLAGLAPGRYFWRVAAVNRDGLEGAFSRTSFFSVVEPQTPPSPPPPPPAPLPLLVLHSVEEVTPGVIYVGGRTAAGARVEVNGTPVRVMPDGSFGEYLRGTGARQVLVRSTAADGTVSELSRAVPGR
jgi:hypothetical protein